ncbi:MAG: MerR family transcriptional regulator [Firmicutes bacterium]|nr:MerR family transcriptional regulator [Bacillota bacterium]
MNGDMESMPFFHISVVSQMLNLHPQTIRNYERMGLIAPSRTDGKMRLFSQKDVNKVKRIHTYTSMGVNLAGVEIIMKLLERIDEMERMMMQATGETQQQMLDNMQNLQSQVFEEMKKLGMGGSSKPPEDKI